MSRNRRPVHRDATAPRRSDEVTPGLGLAAGTFRLDLASRRRFLLVQPECAGDAVAGDRILLVHFSDAIAAADVQATLQDGLDTPG
jgi:hypothetical protein